MVMVKEKMIDIHNHLLYEVDDGAKSIEDSIKALKDLSLLGYDSVILTPHYITNTRYNYSKQNNLKRLELLKEELKNNSVYINLYLGNEIYIDDKILNNLNKGLISSLNDSKYLLIELPMSGKYDDYIEVFTELINNDYKIILAHPERYTAFQKDFSLIEELSKLGVLFQGNIESIIGSYGINAKKMMRKLLKQKKLSFLATDIHHKKRDYNTWKKAKKDILKYITQKEWDILSKNNPSQLID